MDDNEIIGRLDASLDALRVTLPTYGIIIIAVDSSSRFMLRSNMVPAGTVYNLEHAALHIRGECKLCPASTNESTNS